MAEKEENKVIVELAGKDFVIKRIPMARVRMISKTLTNAFRDFKDKELTEGTVLEKLIERVLEFPYEILSLFIKDLPKEIFEDEEDGVTYPEFIDALKVAIELNRLDTLKDFFIRLAPALSQVAVATTQVKGK